MFKNKELVQNTTISTDLTHLTEQDGKDWFADQYEKVIGKPLPRKELTTDEVLKRLKDSAKYRWISEAKSYKPPVPQAGTVHYLEWSDPQITRCTCPDRDCTCRGGFLLPRRKIPRGQKYYKSPWRRKLMQCFRKPVAPPARSFMQRLADVAGVEAAFYKDLERNGVLSIRGAEFCTSRCIRYYGPGQFPNSKYLQDKQRQWEMKIKTDNNADEEGRICDSFSCTVSTQTVVGPNGEFIIGNYSHILFGPLDETVVRDIEGTELHISSYKSMRDKSQYPTEKPCSLDKLLSWRELINLGELKNHLSLIKRNIFFSIFELKETIGPDRNLTTQCEEECASKKSSDKISLATPYKSVVIKAKKEPQDIPNDKIIEEIHRTSQIESAECNIIYDSSINQLLQKQSDIQSEKAGTDNQLGLSIKNKESPYEQLEIQGEITPISADTKSVLEINDVNIKNTKYVKEICNEINGIEPLNLKSSQINSKQISQETIKSHKVESLPQHRDKNIENTEVEEKQLSKNRLFKEIKHFENPGHYISKGNIGNFFKKRLYGLSFEHLQKIKINKFTKSFSCTRDSNKISNNNEIKPNNFNKMLKVEITQNNTNLKFNDKTKSEDDIRLESVQSNVLADSKTSTKKSQKDNLSLKGNELGSTQDALLLMNSFKEPRSYDQTPIIENEAKNSKQQDDVTFISMNDKCTLDEKMATSIDNGYKIVTSSDDKINTDLICKTYSLGKNRNYEHNFDDPKSSPLQSKNNSISEPKSKEILLHDSNRDKSSNVAETSADIGKDSSKEESCKSPSVIIELSNVSLQLKKLIWKKIYHSIKSLPERTLPNYFRSNTQKTMSEIDHRRNDKSDEKAPNKEPKSSEKEVFSIQYTENELK